VEWPSIGSDIAQEQNHIDRGLFSFAGIIRIRFQGYSLSPAQNAWFKSNANLTQAPPTDAGTGRQSVQVVYPQKRGLFSAALGPGVHPDGPLDTIPDLAPRVGYPAARSRSFDVPERPITTYVAAASYNIFYEFIFDGDLKNVWPLTEAYEPFPMTIKAKGLVEKSLRSMWPTSLERWTWKNECIDSGALRLGR